MKKKIIVSVLLASCSQAFGYIETIHNKSDWPIMAEVMYGGVSFSFGIGKKLGSFGEAGISIGTELASLGEQMGGIIFPGESRTVYSGGSCSTGVKIHQVILKFFDEYGANPSFAERVLTPSRFDNIKALGLWNENFKRDLIFLRKTEVYSKTWGPECWSHNYYWHGMRTAQPLTWN